MKLKKDSWHYRLASSVFSQDGLENGRVNICPYFWATVLVMVANAVFGLVWVLTAVFTVWLARLPDMESNTISKPIKNYPKIGRFTPRPIYIILLGLLIWNYGAVFEAAKTLVFSPLLWYVAGSILILAVIFLALNAWRKTEAWKILCGYVKAKKEKVCPLIEFE